MRVADAVAADLAIQQCGAFGRWQLLARGVDDDAIRIRIRSGTWLAAVPGVYRLAVVPASFEQRAWVGWLAVGPGGLVSHEAAAHLAGMANVVRNRVTLISPHGWHHRLPGIVVHQLDDVLPDHRTSHAGLPVTTPARTIVDLAALVSPARLASIVEDASHARLVSYSDVGLCLTSIARRGKPGIRKLTKVLDHLTNTNAMSMSRLERLLFELLSAAGMPKPKPQFPFPGRSFTNGCVDAAYVDAKLVLEADGRSWHTRIADLKRDHERDADAARHGWQTLRLLHENISGDACGTAALIRDVRRERLCAFSRR
jgi:hypothetical protein